MVHILGWGCLQRINLGIKIKKGEIATNVLGVWSQEMQFIYVLTGWEGSTSDGRVLHDAICKTNGFDIPNGRLYTRNKQILKYKFLLIEIWILMI